MTVPTIEVRRPRREEARAIAELNVETWEAAYRGIVPERFFEDRRARGEDEASWWESLQREGRDTLVALEGGRVVGYASWTLDGGEAELSALYVSPAAWGRGVGARLFRGACEVCRAAGGQQLAVWLLEANDRARRFYEAMGARSTSQRRMFPLLPELELAEIQMELDLTSGSTRLGG